MDKVVDNNSFIKKASLIHSGKYDYSRVEYVNSHTKVCIICPEHGEFWQTPNNHLRGKGCPKCAGRLSVDKESFIREAIKVHGHKYDYSKTEYVNTATKICIVCKKHGEFWQTPNHHLNGCGCPLCSHQSFKDDVNRFIEKARKAHGGFYDYSKVEYVNSHTKVCIICPEHGEFWQTPTNHIRGKGCPKCKAILLSNARRSSTEEFIKKASLVHRNKYDYSKVEYINNRTKVCIICPEHGEFWQTPNSHLNGKGCPKCRESHLERDVRNALIDNNITFSANSHFKWLGKQHLDFFLPEYNVAIECQGEQHFVLANKFNKKRTLDEIIEKDVLKNSLCVKNNVTLLYYTSPLVFSLAKEKNAIYNGNLFTSVADIIQKIRDTK